MKITKIEIKNYRSLEKVTIYPKSMLALIGGNNTGKSSILKALQLFFDPSTTAINEECFFGKKTDNPIEIFLTFQQLTSCEKEEFADWIDEDELVVGREISCTGEACYQINSVVVKQVPEQEWLQVGVICGDTINDWWKSKNDLKIGDLNFGDILSGAKPKVGDWIVAAKKFTKDNATKLKFIQKRVSIPKTQLTILKCLPEFIFIPAVREVSDETKVNKTNPFGQLINSFFDLIPAEEKEALAKQIKEIEKRLNRCGEKNRFKQIEEFEKSLNNLMSQLMECDIEIQINMPQLSAVLGAAKIYTDDGVRTTIEMKGHGMQRSMIFTILRAYSEMTHLRKVEEKTKQRTTIFAFEEPELYLHPQSQRTLANVFRKISEGSDQIVYCTHSSLFVDITYFDEICIMRRGKKQEGFRSSPSQLFINDFIVDLKTRKNLVATELGIREQYSNAFNPMINEGFFADKVVIVEGASEQYSLPIYADCFGYDLNRSNVSVVHSDGKGPIDRILRIFSGFGIPCYTWFDGDKNNKDKDTTDKTLELLSLFNEPIDAIASIVTKVRPNYAVLEETLEAQLKSELPDYDEILKQAVKELGPTGKPLKNRFIAVEIQKRVKQGKSAKDVVPKTIHEIIEAVKNLTFQGSILKK